MLRVPSFPMHPASGYAMSGAIRQEAPREAVRGHRASSPVHHQNSLRRALPLDALPFEPSSSKMRLTTPPLRTAGRSEEQRGKRVIVGEDNFYITPREETPCFKARQACHEFTRTPSGIVTTTLGGQTIEFWEGAANISNNMDR